MNVFKKTKRMLRYLAIIAFWFILVSDLSAESLNGRIVYSTQHELRIIDLAQEQTWKKPLSIDLPNTTDMAHHPSWSPDGDEVVFEYTQIINNMNFESKLASLDIIDNSVNLIKGFQLARKGNYPKWSPDGKYIAAIEKVGTKMFRDKAGAIIDQKRFCRLIVSDCRTGRSQDIAGSFADYSPFSWSRDSRKIVYVDSDQTLIIFDIVEQSSKRLVKGKCPIFGPNGTVYFIDLDAHLYKIDSKKDPVLVDEGDWNWNRLIAITNDNNNVIFVEGGNFLMMEYSCISLFDLSSLRKQSLSKRHSIIHGADLFQDN